MSRRRSRSWKPAVEAVEDRRLLSAATVAMASDQQTSVDPTGARAVQADRSTVVASTSLTDARSGFAPSRSSIALPEDQGPQGADLLLQPTGEMTPQQYGKSLYTATFAGDYTIGPGRFDTEALQLAIQGVGRTTNIRHADIQIGIIVARDPSIQNSGASTIFDRNLNSNSSVFLFLASPSGDVDSHGRPDRFESVSTDADVSGGAFVQGFSRGVLQIRYAPNGKRTPGVIEQGKAYIRFTGQVYSPKVGDVLRNSNINP